MGRDDQTKLLVNPSTITAHDIFKHETILIRESRLDQEFILPTPERPLSDSNDLLVLNSPTSVGPVRVATAPSDDPNDFAEILPGFGTSFRWSAGNWFIMIHRSPTSSEDESLELLGLMHTAGLDRTDRHLRKDLGKTRIELTSLSNQLLVVDSRLIREDRLIRSELTRTQSDLDNLSKLLSVFVCRLEHDHHDITSNLLKVRQDVRGLGGLWSQTAKLFLPHPTLEVSAAELNAAAATTFERSFALWLTTDKEELAYPFSGASPTITPGESVTDPDVGAPSVVGTPTFVDGIAGVTLQFDTDAGATKTYISGDSVDADCDLTVYGDYVLSQETFTFNVVA